MRIRRPFAATRFPYTTLFRSCRRLPCLPLVWKRAFEQGVEPLGVLVDHLLALVTDGRVHHVAGCPAKGLVTSVWRSEEHTSELQSPCKLVCRLLLEKENQNAK